MTYGRILDIDYKGYDGDRCYIAVLSDLTIWCGLLSKSSSSDLVNWRKI